MDFSWFFLLGLVPTDAITGTYSTSLVALSYLIASMASYVALDLAGRLRSEQNSKIAIYWLLGGAFAMGAGIWSMHFIGMLAFNLPMPMSYDPIWTGASMLAAILAAAFALYLLKNKGLPTLHLIAGGVLLGLGIATMHYMGMEAMKVHINIHYLPGLFFLSIVIAILASETALWLALQSNQGAFKRQIRLKIISALVMGAAICGMHYTGMAAAIFTHSDHISGSMLTLDPRLLALSIATVTGLIIGVALIVSTYKQLMNSALQNEKNFLNAILINLHNDIIACDANGKIILFNRAIQKNDNPILAHNANIEWNTYFDLYLPNGETLVTAENNPLFRSLNGEYIHNSELIMVTKAGTKRNVVIDGQPIFTQENKKLGAVIAIHDITERKHMEEQLIQQATHDALTGLPNRSLLLDRINQAITQAKRANYFIAILFLDLDRFKLINDSFGHAEGDELLCAITQRLQKCVRETDTLARFGGDEFVAVITNLQHEERAGFIAQKMLMSLSEVININNRKVNITTSIGISIYPKNGENADILLRNADSAMYLAKEKGRNNFKYYTEELNFSTTKRLELESYLHLAIERHEFFLMYQPIIDMQSGYIIGVEALIRWQHPTLGLILPLDFIPLAEENGLITPIGDWVLRTACQQNKTWQKLGLPHIRMSINISGRQLSESDLTATIQKVLNETQLEPQYVELELTESSIIKQSEAIIKTLKSLKKMGIKIALDDFGTGYSSLSYLKRLPVDKLKIDKTFVQDVTNSTENAAIVLAVIAMANSLKLKVLAEGMETEQQFGFLRFHRCDEIQGYYFSHPLTAEACTELLRKNPKLVDNIY